MRETKREMLNKAGIDVDKMMQYLLDNDGKAIISLKDGVIMISEEEDKVLEAIKNDGYLHNPTLFRRWIMAQMFHMIDQNAYLEKKFYTASEAYNYRLDHYRRWEYQIDFLIDEVHRINKITGSEREEYTRICTIPVIHKIVEEIYQKTEEAYKDKKKKNKKAALLKMEHAKDVILHCGNYREMEELLTIFRARMLTMYDVKKVRAFKDMYKGIGAYWTCKNLIMHHNCVIYGLNTHESMKVLEEKTRRYFNHTDYFNHYYEGGFRLFAFMNKLIEDNGFDYKARMRELGVYTR